MTNDLAKWLLKQYNLMATDEMPDLHLRTCQTHKQVTSPMPTVIADTPMSCNCPALDWWLADLASKRKIVADIAPEIDSLDDSLFQMAGLPGEQSEPASMPLLKQLAAPLARRPGYREEWRP